MKIKLVIILILLSFFRLEGQNQGDLWFLGDSLGLDFGYQPPMKITSPVSSTKVCLATLCDTLGNLQYYEQSISTDIDTGISVFDKLHNRIPMMGGTKGNWRSVNSFLPFTNTDITGYLVGFINVNPAQNHYGMQELYFSRLNNSLRNQLGNWLENYNLPVSTFDSIRGGGGGTGISYTRHANGRDWWIVGKKHRDDSLLVWLATPDSVYNIHRLKIGSNNSIGNISPAGGVFIGVLMFSQNGERLLNVNGEGLIEIFSFDRCTGIISSPVTIEAADATQTSSSSRGMFSACLSSSGRFIYACQYDFINLQFNLVQYDINSINPSLNKVILFNQSLPFASADRGFISAQLGPDGKIYLVPRNVGGGYPVDSTCLSTIDFPETPGIGCGFMLNSICYSKIIHSSHFSLAPNWVRVILWGVRSDIYCRFSPSHCPEGTSSFCGGL